MHSGILDRADGDVRKARGEMERQASPLHEIEIKKANSKLF